MKDVYVLLDPMQIQRYVFATNKLSIIIGSSLALARWQETCKTLCATYRGELVTAGGGNVLASFSNGGEAENFRRQAIGAAPPGLEVAWAQVDAKGGDPTTWTALQTEIGLYKAGDRPLPDYPPPAVPIFSGCRYCGINPGDGMGKMDDKDICTTCRTLHQTGVALHDHHDGSTPIELLYLMAEVEDFPGYFPKELEMLTAREGFENDQMAVVVIDLNNLGARVMEEVKDRGFKGLNKLSTKLEDIMNQIAQDLILGLARRKDKQGQGIDLKSGDLFIRARPLLLGGDDLVIALPAPLWPELVEAALRRLSLLGFPACAGVAVAKDNFPINRLTEMAEKIVANAKKLVRYRKTQQPSSFSECALDWHVHQEAAFSLPLEVRRRNYLRKVGTGHYELATQRPYTLEDFVDLRGQVKGLTGSNRKLFALYQALRKGGRATRDALVYTFFRDESEHLDKYGYLWDLVKQIGKDGDFPLWERQAFTKGGYSATLHDTRVTDLLELKFLQEG